MQQQGCRSARWGMCRFARDLLYAFGKEARWLLYPLMLELSINTINGLRQSTANRPEAASPFLASIARRCLSRKRLLDTFFTGMPFAGQRVKELRDVSKTYLWDLTQLPEPGARFENPLALHMPKFCHHLEDFGAHPSSLHLLQLCNGRNGRATVSPLMVRG